MLMSETMLRTMRLLLVSDKERSIRELARDADVTLSRCAREVEQLRMAGYVSRRPLVKVERRWDLLSAFSHGWSVRAVPSEPYEAVERPEYLMKAISSCAERSSLPYGFTMLAGAELLSPQVVPAYVHLYIEAADAPKWRRALGTIGIHPSEPGSPRKVNLLLWDRSVFTGVMVVRGSCVVAPVQVFADLHGMGGIFRDAAMTMAKRMNWVAR
jgi:hypothetical protein